MKNLLFMLILIVFFNSSLLAQDSKPSKASLDVVQEILEQNTKKAQQAEILGSFYQQLSDEVIVVDSLINEMLNPANTRGRCTAECSNGTSVSCSGSPCTGVDNSGCGSVNPDPDEEGAVIITVELCDDEVFIE